MTDPAADSPAGDPGPGPEPATRSSLAGTRRAHPALLIGGVVALVVVVAGLFVALRPQEYRVVVPAGTGARLDAGESVELMPRDLALNVGDTMIIENQDTRNHTVGPFSVRAGETLDYTFSSSGVFKGACTVHPSGEVTITVS